MKMSVHRESLLLKFAALSCVHRAGQQRAIEGRTLAVNVRRPYSERIT